MEQLIENPGTTIGGVVGQPATSFEPRSTVDIGNRVAQGVRPRVAGNDQHDVTGGRINRPSPNLAAKLAAGDEERRTAEREAAEARRDQMKTLDPLKMEARIGFLERSNKKLLKELSELKKLLSDK